MFKNPLEHNEIIVEKAVELGANEVLVVYKQDGQTQVVQRYLEYGPTKFIPGSNEWYVVIWIMRFNKSKLIARWQSDATRALEVTY